MKKNGFTLIELLAVIVILAIIALIAVPIVLNIINNSKDSADQRSIELYADAIKNAVTQYQLKNTQSVTGTFITTDGRTLTGDTTLTVEYDGEDVVCETIKIYEDGNIYLANCTVNGQEVEYTYGENQDANNEEVEKKQNYENGDVVYFDVVAGKGCTQKEYEKSWDETTQDYLNSKTAYNGINNYSCVYNGYCCYTCTEINKASQQNSCLKFYAFNDEGGDTLNLLLDHNTNPGKGWNLDPVGYPSTEEGYVLKTLKADTAEWNGTITPSNYTTGPSSNKYTIDYSGYKARLITANEVAKIVGYKNWNETSTSSTWFYFDTLTQTAPTSGYKYGWLYDRVSHDCETY